MAIGISPDSTAALQRLRAKHDVLDAQIKVSPTESVKKAVETLLAAG